MKRVILLGCTGSIGRNTLDVIRRFPDSFRIVALSAHTDERALALLCKEFHPEAAALSGIEGKRPDVRYTGPSGLLEMIRETEADILVNAVAGTAGLMPSVEALSSGKDLALANKETIVVAGPLVTALAEKKGREILPVDSEHSAVFHLLKNRRREEIEEIILTASGGPFLHTPAEALVSITPASALDHPVWKMGRKITIDSASLANKGLEVLEALYYFNIDLERIRVLIHPQGKVHSLIRTVDGALYAQISDPDMRIPILNALSYPDLKTSPYGRLDLADSTLRFEAPDTARFPLLALAYEAGRAGGGYPAAYNGADEAAVEAFLDGRITFTAIAEIVEETLAAGWENLVVSCEHAGEIAGRAYTHAATIISRRDGSSECC